MQSGELAPLPSLSLSLSLLARAKEREGANTRIVTMYTAYLRATIIFVGTNFSGFRK